MSRSLNRRDFFSLAAGTAVFVATRPSWAWQAVTAPPAAPGPTVVTLSDPWASVPAILARIAPPAIPKRDFAITSYGARGDGRTDSSRAIEKAIAAASKAGGGRVVVPQGDFLTGPIRLRSRIELHV